MASELARMGLGFYRQMLLIRRFEERAAEAYTQGKIGGFLHLYIGEEAVAVGAMSAIRPEDQLITHYRDHGYALARGLPAGPTMAELFGKATGVSKGRGGSMHLADVSRGFWGGHAIVGNHIPVAAGLGLAAQMLGERRVVLCIFGDGATNGGEFHEGLNMAAIWDLPVVFLCENNMYGMGASLAEESAIKDVYKKADAYGIPGQPVDGMDVFAVRQSVLQAVERARDGGGPSLVEAHCYRYRGHSMSDPEAYRQKGEVQRWRQRDPIETLATLLREEGVADSAKLDRIVAEVEAEIDEAVRFANDSPEPSLENLYDDLLATPGEPLPHPPPAPHLKDKEAQRARSAPPRSASQPDRRGGHKRGAAAAVKEAPAAKPAQPSRGRR